MSVPVTATVGVFDGVHAGHRALLDDMRCAGASVRVYTFTDHPMCVIAPQAAPRLLTPASVKRDMLLDAGADDVVMLDFADIRPLTAGQFMRRLSADGVTRLMLGFNNRFGSDRLTSLDAYRSIGRGMGIEVSQAAPLIYGDAPVSSTRIRALLADGELTDANRMLTSPYTLTGSVAAGRHLGRTIGFPTANIVTDSRQLLPAAGAYAAIATVDGREMPAMVNIGTRPTVDSDPEITVEAHIIGLDADLYGRTVSVRLVSRIRPVERFGSIDHLRAQLEHDRQTTLNILRH